ncbi:MAG TPA: DUF362 domain-containing protein [Kofleriaceae bacterium]|nr:DUF362 domain-containing protein [Kofleriaceae bacterium]
MADRSSLVAVSRVATYGLDAVRRALPASVFDAIRPGDRVVLKPNWVMEGHKDDPAVWEHVITHPALITATIEQLVARGAGRISVVDGPMTEASFATLIARYPVDQWRAIAGAIPLEIIDLRDLECTTAHGIVVERRTLPGDPRGKVEVDLAGAASAFHGHARSRRGYYGADYDRAETNRAHDGHHNIYSVSRTALECDVFINLPKLKTHRKAGITACLKNLVGINTYKNYLPHHSEGGPSEGGDQFPADNVNARIEGPLMAFLKQRVLRDARLARALAPLNHLGRRVFGDTRRVVRSGNWYGNDTIWRMILDLNKVLLYANADGTLRPDGLASAKRYIGIVDAIAAGAGEGPLAPDRADLGYVIAGTNPVAIDAVCAVAMGFDPARIPSIANAFAARRYPLVDFASGEVRVELDGRVRTVDDARLSLAVTCEPHFGWKGHIEAPVDHVGAAS